MLNNKKYTFLYPVITIENKRDRLNFTILDLLGSIQVLYEMVVPEYFKLLYKSVVSL